MIAAVPIEGWRFLEIWERVVVPKLAAAGYQVKAENAVRTRGHSVELIHLERDARREAGEFPGVKARGKNGRFTINLALGHDFARSFRDGKPLPMRGYEDAVFHARLGRLMEGKDLWWGFGESAEEAEKTLQALGEIAIAYGEAFFDSLRDPGTAYLTLKKGDLGRENLWHLAIYAKHLGKHEEALEWLDRIAGPPPHAVALRKRWTDPESGSGGDADGGGE